MKILRYPVDSSKSQIAATIRMHKDNCCGSRRGIDPDAHP